MPKLKPILIGVIYRPPTNYRQLFLSSITDAKHFDTYEAYILGDFNINLNTDSKSEKYFVPPAILDNLLDTQQESLKKLHPFLTVF